MIPNPSNPQGWNRYSYVQNNPINASDPTGHRCVGDVEECQNDNGKPINGADKDEPPLNDPNWGKKKNIEEKSNIVWNAICKSGGWWGSGCPSENDLSAWLLYEEGSTLNYSDQVNMAKGIRYRFDRFGFTPQQLSGFTAFFNPVRDGVFDNKDWLELTALKEKGTTSMDLTEYHKIIDKVYSQDIQNADGKYLYWFEQWEVSTPKGQWPGEAGKEYIQTSDVTGQVFYFTGIPNIRTCAMSGINCSK